MRHIQSSFERLFEPREIYGIPMSNLIIVLTICLSVFRSAFMRIVRPLSARITNHRGSSSTMKDHEFRIKHEQVTRKGQKYLFHLLWFVVMVPWEIRLGRAAPWFDFSYTYSSIRAAVRSQAYGMKLVNDSQGNSISVAHDPRDEPWFQEFHFFMIIQLAWYVHNFIEETLWDRMRGDYTLMVTHHLVTIVLLVFAVQLGFELGGMYTIFVMDIMDLILYSCKVFHLSGTTVDGKPRGYWHVVWQKVWISATLCSWILLRILCFNSVIFAAHDVFMGSDTDNVFLLNPDYATSPKGITQNPFLASCVYVLLLLLAVLQTSWTYLIYRVWHSVIFSGYLDDDVFRTHAETMTEEGSTAVHSGKQE